jgi:hypothetical protein
VTFSLARRKHDGLCNHNPLAEHTKGDFDMTPDRLLAQAEAFKVKDAKNLGNGHYQIPTECNSFAGSTMRRTELHGPGMIPPPVHDTRRDRNERASMFAQPAGNLWARRETWGAIVRHHDIITLWTQGAQSGQVAAMVLQLPLPGSEDSQPTLESPEVQKKTDVASDSSRQVQVAHRDSPLYC